jgi:hypothetical protein
MNLKLKYFIVKEKNCIWKANVVSGYLVSCYGRMRLYEELFKIDDRVLYFDTDSIIFISKENHYEPELADNL